MNAAQVAPEFNSFTIKVKTPTGSMFVTILENESGKPCKVFIHVGKTGTDVAAWAASLAGSINAALNAGSGINDVIRELSQNTSDKSTMNGDIDVRSGPEGLFYALQLYRKAKYRELTEMLGRHSEHNRASLDS